jgi:aspartyl-tRNA(Asn)/glutamyl-tRNA(Gln) amidotransferase subunit B
MIQNNPKMVKQYRAGKTKFLLAMAGEIAKKTDNRINMVKVMEILKKKLES